MNAWFKTGKPERLARLLQETHDYFHKDNRWAEHAMAKLGRSCLENEIYRAAVDYLEEAIVLRQRTAPRCGIGDGTLSGYYGDQARAFAGLKKTSEAVDAAAAAVVAWGRNGTNRNHALKSLRGTLRAAPDLDAYVVQLDKRAAETREENPILRKAIGLVYRDRSQFGKAVAQLRIAVEVQPDDAETYQALLACYDRQNDQQGAVEQILAWRQLATATANFTRISASDWRNWGRQRRPNGPIRRSSKCCPPSRKVISFWRKSASGRTAGPRRSSSGSRSPASARSSPPA